MQAAATGTSDVLSKGLEDAKRNWTTWMPSWRRSRSSMWDNFPGDEENNLKILMGLNSQLEANTQTLNRAQQDKAYTESMLAQQLAAWKSSQSSTNPQTLEKQLSDLQSQLLRSAGALHRRSSRRDQDESRHRGSEEETGRNQQGIRGCRRYGQRQGFGDGTAGDPPVAAADSPVSET